LPRQPDPPPPPAREEPPKPKDPEPDDIGKLGDKISDAADEVADKVEAFSELIEDRQEDIDEAVETFREIGRALEATGRETRGEVNNVDVPPIGVWKYHENKPPYGPLADDAPLAENPHSAGGVTVEPEPSDESDKAYPWWLPWVALAGVGIWALNRKPK